MNTGFIPPAPTSSIAPAPAPQQDALPIDIVVLKYRQLRDKESEIKKRHAAELEPYQTIRSQLENMLLDQLNTSGAQSVRTENGTAYKTAKTSYKIVDPAVLREYIALHGLNDLYENRISSTALEEMLAQGKPLPPGIDVNTFVSVNVRK